MPEFHVGGRGRADESHLTGESEDVLKRPGGAALMLSGAKARCRCRVVDVGCNCCVGGLLLLRGGPMSS